MAREYELISHSQFRNLNILVVRLAARTPHIHRDLEIGMVLEGEVTLNTDGRRFPLGPGDCYLVNPMALHDFRAENGGAVVLAIQCSSRLMASFSEKDDPLRFEGGAALHELLQERPDRYSLLRFICAELACSYLRDGPDREIICLNLITLLLKMLHEDIPHAELNSDDLRTLNRKTERILSVVEYIDANFSRKLLLDEIAAREGLSMVYLSHLFRDIMGMPYQEYLKQKRFENACRLLVTTDRTLMDICISSGFSDLRYLTRAFLEKTGCTPAEYRRASVVRPGDYPESEDTSQVFFTRRDAEKILLPLRDQLYREVKLFPLSALFGG